MAVSGLPRQCGSTSGTQARSHASIEPVDDESPIAAFTRQGGGLHHLCFRVPSVSAELARLAALGLRTLTPPQPGEAFADEPIAFVYAGDGLNVELIDTDRRAGLLAGPGIETDA